METEQLIKQGIENASTEIREYLANSAWNTITDNIATQSNLTEDQKIALENEVLFVLIGFDLKKNLTKNIIENIGLSSIIAGGLAIELDQKVFMPVQNFLPTEMEGESSTNLQTETIVQAIVPSQASMVIIPPPSKPQTTLEEKIAPLIGEASEKVDWEERKIALEKNKIMTDSYSGKDPYREPIQ